MRALLYPLLVLILGLSGIKHQPMRDLDYPEMGVSLQIPETWDINDAPRVTMKKHFEVSGQNYVDADSTALAMGLLYFSELEVDSLAIPAPEAYEWKALYIEMHSYYNPYKRWLWSTGRKTLFQPAPVFRGQTQDVEDQSVTELEDDDHRKIISDTYAVEFSRKKGDAEVGTIGQIYWVVKGARCYRITIEGTDRSFEDNRPLFNRILQSIQFTE